MVSMEDITVEDQEVMETIMASIMVDMVIVEGLEVTKIMDMETVEGLEVMVIIAMEAITMEIMAITMESRFLYKCKKDTFLNKENALILPFF